MRVVTIVSLGACALFGLGALVVANTMMPGHTAAKAAPAAGSPVVVAKAPLKFGDRLDATKLEILKLPTDAVPEGAFTTVAQVLAQDKGGPPVALTAIATREPLLPSKLSGPGARASVASELSDGMRAYTIKVTDVTGVGGHALPGDRVDVVLTRDLTPETSKHTYVSQIVIQKSRVLAVDLNSDPASNKPATPSTATIEVSIPDAQKLAVAADLGKLSLALRRTGSDELAPTTLMHTSSILGGEAPVRQVRASVRRAPIPAGPFIPPAPSLITVVEAGGGSGKPHMPRPKPAPTPEAPPAAAASSNTGPVVAPTSKPA
jgi:pilus assembly protein CpaB